MTLANFNSKHVDKFVSSIFESNVSDVNTINIDKMNNNGQPPGYPQPGNGQQPYKEKNIDEMNDNEFEGALDDFIKSLKDV